MIKFPSIDQFRHAISSVKQRVRYAGKAENGTPLFNETRTLPTLRFTGTVKLHGTNAAIVLTDGSYTYQSRERVLTLEEDNAGFMRTMLEQPVTQLFDNIAAVARPNHQGTIAVYGEWCGQGIQRGVAISELSKRFVIFAILIDGEWYDHRHIFLDIPGSCFHSIYDFPYHSIDIDFNRPDIAQNKLVELTDAVEKLCPVGAHFGVDGIGEGIVWWCDHPDFRDCLFKVKGEKHSASKVRVLAAVDVERMNSILELVSQTVTEARMEQGLHVLKTELLKPLEMTSIGDFIRWVFNDVMKEEADTIEASGFDRKALGGPIANVCRTWFIQRVNSGVNDNASLSEAAS